VTGYCGLLLQELDFERSIYESDVSSIDSFMKGVAKPNRLAIITSGAGTKVWLRNTAGQTVSTAASSAPARWSPTPAPSRSVTARLERNPVGHWRDQPVHEGHRRVSRPSCSSKQF
jgi:hypothetical protein